MAGKTHSHRIKASCHDIRNLIRFRHNEGHRAGPKGLHQGLGHRRKPFCKRLHILFFGNMENQGIIGRTALSGKDFPACHTVKAIGPKAVDRFRRECDNFPFPDQGGRFRYGLVPLSFQFP